MLTEVTTTHELLGKKIFEINLRKNNYVVFQLTFEFELDYDE
jgi:hypothetical protein